MDNDYSSDIDNQDQSSATPKQQVVEKLRDANNVLVTVKSNPSVDELAATIGLTIMLNKLDKHTTAVFSGEVPSTLEFLKPEETIETNTDSLRDFIVSLDKSKADKLRYKVEENVVKIYITPYRTSISEADLEFTQGDFNVDAVVALGVTKREELDNAITAHGRILHDATFITVTTGSDFSELGQINWQDQGASSLSEMLVSISESFESGLIDTQIATAFLTGIVAETQRFSNPKTTPKVMTMSAQLMAAGANQQLIANELEKANSVSIDHSGSADDNDDAKPQEVETSSDGTLSINHDKDEATETKPMTIEELEARHKDTNSEPSVELPNSSSQVDVTPVTTEQTPSETFRTPVLSDSSRPVGDGSERLYSDNYGQTGTPVAPPVAPETTNPVANTQPLGQASQLGLGAPEPQQPGVLPPLDEQPEPTVVAPSQPVDPVEQSASLVIDKEGNMLRNAASQPKHKVLQPISNEPTVSPSDNVTTSPEATTGIDSVPQPQQDTPLPAVNDILQPPSLPQEQQNNPVPVFVEEEIKTSNPNDIPIEDKATLTDIEKAVDSPHLKTAPEISSTDTDTSSLNDARNAVFDALGHSDSVASFEAPRADLNALPLSAPPEAVPYDTYRLPDTPEPRTVSDVSGNVPDASLGIPSSESDKNAPPPVPPPMMPPTQTAL